MKERGQLSFKTVFTIIISIVVLSVIVFFISSVSKVSERAETVEILNFKTTIETRVLQQSVKTIGSLDNITVAVPNSISKVCFFDSNIGYDSVSNTDITGLFSDDKINNLFFLTEDDFFAYRIQGVEMVGNPLCAKIIGGKITLKVESRGDKVRISAQEEHKDMRCVSVFENGDSKSKIDIVFLGYGFDDIAEYDNQVNRYMNNILLEFAPFNSSRGKFNFYKVDDAELSCSISGFISCNKYGINLAASDCPHDYIILLVDRSEVVDFVKPVRSSAMGNIMKINTADKPFVLVHEFGHAFGDLADEYVDENYYTSSNFNPSRYPNCDSAPCPSWQGTDNTACYQGCSLKKYFRPTETSIMRSLSSPDFGPINEREIQKRLLFYE